MLLSSELCVLDSSYCSRANLLALEAVDRAVYGQVADVAAAGEAVAGGLRRYNVASGKPHTVGEMAAALAGAFGGGLEPVVTGEYRLGDVRHVVASPRPPPRTSGSGQDRVRRGDGAEFAHAALREPALAASARMLDPHGVPDGRPRGRRGAVPPGRTPRMLGADPRS